MEREFKEEAEAMATAFLKIEGRALRLSMGCQDTLEEWNLYQIAWADAVEWCTKKVVGIEVISEPGAAIKVERVNLTDDERESLSLNKML